jgi:hypothetical protein
VLGAEPDPRVAALARDVERATRRVGELETLLRQLAADVAALPRLAQGPGDGGPADERGRVRAWLLAEDRRQAASDLGDLAEWLHRVYLRYPDAALPSCWLWHPAVIEELWWLRRAHADAYDPELESWQRVADWHDRQRPGVVQRLGKAVGTCELALHRGGHDQATPRTDVPLRIAAAHIADTWTTARTAPEPTTDQLTEAQHHEHDQNHTRHR